MGAKPQSQTHTSILTLNQDCSTNRKRERNNNIPSFWDGPMDNQRIQDFKGWDGVAGVISPTEKAHQQVSSSVGLTGPWHSKDNQGTEQTITQHCLEERTHC